MNAAIMSTNAETIPIPRMNQTVTFIECPAPFYSESMSVQDKCTEILLKTNDGQDLAPEHLHLVIAAVNGELTETGKALIGELWSQVSDGSYR